MNESLYSLKKKTNNNKNKNKTKQKNIFIGTNSSCQSQMRHIQMMMNFVLTNDTKHSQYENNL